MRLQDAAPPLPRFLVYWKHVDQQLFAFTTSVHASTSSAARAIAGARSPAAAEFWASSSWQALGCERCTGAAGWPDTRLEFAPCKFAGSQPLETGSMKCIRIC